MFLLMYKSAKAQLTSVQDENTRRVVGLHMGSVMMVLYLT